MSSPVKLQIPRRYWQAQSTSPWLMVGIVATCLGPSASLKSPRSPPARAGVSAPQVRRPVLRMIPPMYPRARGVTGTSLSSATRPIPRLDGEPSLASRLTRIASAQRSVCDEAPDAGGSRGRELTAAIPQPEQRPVVRRVPVDGRPAGGVQEGDGLVAQPGEVADQSLGPPAPRGGREVPEEACRVDALRGSLGVAGGRRDAVRV